MGEKRYVTDKNGNVHTIEICSRDEMPPEERAMEEAFQDCVDLAIFVSKFRGHPVVRVDKNHSIYWEFPDGRIEYRDY